MHGDLYNLKNIDINILEELSINARQNSSEIARKVGLNYKTVRSRIQKLKSDKILLSTRAMIDHKLLGYNYYKLFIFLSNASKKRFLELKTYLTNKLEVIYIMDSIGTSADLEAEFMFRSNADFIEFLDGFQDKFSDIIKETNYVNYIKTFKVGYLPP